MGVHRYQIIHECNNLLGTPFEHQGRSAAGCDCAGVLYLIARRFNMDTKDLPQNPTYGRDPDGTMRKILNKYLTKRSISQRKPGTILFFGYGKHGQHVGIVAKDPIYFYHNFEENNGLSITRLDKRWTRRLRGVYDFNEVID